ncbi:hypothetical protein [Butyricimonas muris]|uniref:hypothetical protein n=1 Tax=Butyricimonas muris TaxID=3378067 RepID=UPI003966C913
MYNYLKQRFKHAIRFRHKRGYGVHSPFVFDLITNVIKEKAEYYDFARIEAMGNVREKERKLYRLIFRLADYFSFREVLCVGVENPWVSRYLAAVSKQMNVLNGGHDCPGAEYTGRVTPAEMKGREIDLLFLGRAFEADWHESWEEVLQERKKGPLCVVIKDIYKGRFNSLVWRQLRQEGTVSIDMMWYGIVFFDERLQKGRYNLII